MSILLDLLDRLQHTPVTAHGHLSTISGGGLQDLGALQAHRRLAVDHPMYFNVFRSFEQVGVKQQNSITPPIGRTLTPFSFSNFKNSLTSSGSSMSIVDPSKDFHLPEAFCGSPSEPIGFFNESNSPGTIFSGEPSYYGRLK
jgi:hypothetical protein